MSSLLAIFDETPLYYHGTGIGIMWGTITSTIITSFERYFDMSLHDIYAWTDSTIVLNWLRDHPHRFKTYVGNRVSSIVNHIPSACWRHVSGSVNPADIASRGLFPAELIHSSLWWKGLSWLYQSEDCWPKSAIELCHDEIEMDELKITAHATSVTFIQTPVIPTDKFSDFNKLVRVTGWIFKFVNNIIVELVLNLLLYIIQNIWMWNSFQWLKDTGSNYPNLIIFPVILFL